MWRRKPNRQPEIDAASADHERVDAVIARIEAQEPEVQQKVQYLKKRGNINHFGVSMLKAFGANPEEFLNGSR